MKKYKNNYFLYKLIMLWESVQMIKKIKPSSYPQVSIAAWSLLSTGVLLKTMDWIHLKNMKLLKK